MVFTSGQWQDAEHIFAIVYYTKKGQTYDYLYCIYDDAPTAKKITKAIADGSLVIDEYQPE